LALYSKWKVISGVMLQQQYEEQIGESDPRSAKVAAALMMADSVLRPLINPSLDMNARSRNLKSIMNRAVQFAFLLFSQPASFQLDFTRGRSDTLVVFPALLQTVNDEAQVLASPRILSQKETVEAA
jgi:hypothetical protein